MSPVNLSLLKLLGPVHTMERHANPSMWRCNLPAVRTNLEATFISFHCLLAIGLQVALRTSFFSLHILRKRALTFLGGLSGRGSLCSCLVVCTRVTACSPGTAHTPCDPALVLYTMRFTASGSKSRFKLLWNDVGSERYELGIYWLISRDVLKFALKSILQNSQTPPETVLFLFSVDLTTRTFAFDWKYPRSNLTQRTEPELCRMIALTVWYLVRQVEVGDFVWTKSLLPCRVRDDDTFNESVSLIQCGHSFNRSHHTCVQKWKESKSNKHHQ